MKTGTESRSQRRFMVLMMFSLFFLTGGIAAAQWFEEQLPPLLPPPQYGNILINRNSVKSDMLPVSFSHWIHRSKYTCRVCHTELEIDMKVNSTEITMDKIGKGQYCGACHDGETAFGQEECQKCHTGDIAAGSDKFKKLPSLPKTGFGNRIDWVEAWKKKLIKPKKALRPGEYSPPTFKKFLTLQAEWNNIPPSIFPHDIHNSWLDCSSCHPDVFNIKLKTTKHFLMTKMFEGKFCGACHLNVAFPLNDCKRCHPAINR